MPDTSLARVKKELQGYEYGKMFIVPSKKTRVQLPGFDGGGEWGGPSFDPETGMLYVNANEMGWLVTMREMKPQTPRKKTTMKQVQDSMKNIAPVVMVRIEKEQEIIQRL